MRRVYIESTAEYLTSSFGVDIRIVDADTRKVLDNVQSVAILISVNDNKVRARLICIEMQGDFIEYKEDVVVLSVHIG